MQKKKSAVVDIEDNDQIGYDIDVNMEEKPTVKILRHFRRSDVLRLQVVRQTYLFLIHDFVRLSPVLPPTLPFPCHMMETAAIGIQIQKQILMDPHSWRRFQYPMSFAEGIDNRPVYQILLSSHHLRTIHLEQLIHPCVLSLTRITHNLI